MLSTFLGNLDLVFLKHQRRHGGGTREQREKSNYCPRDDAERVGNKVGLVEGVTV